MIEDDVDLWWEVFRAHYIPDDAPEFALKLFRDAFMAGITQMFLHVQRLGRGDVARERAVASQERIFGRLNAYVEELNRETADGGPHD